MERPPDRASQMTGRRTNDVDLDEHRPIMGAAEERPSRHARTQNTQQGLTTIRESLFGFLGWWPDTDPWVVSLRVS